MSLRLFAALLLSWAVLPVAQASGSVHCGSRIVAEGDAASKLIAACGEPAYRDVWSVYPLAPGMITDAEEWYYNFGPNQLMRIVRLHGGRIEEISSDGYGYTDPPQGNCTSAELVEGLSKYRLLLKCGEPLTRRILSTFEPYNGRYNARHRARAVFEPVFREEWVYNFGSSALMRAVTLENGRVVHVRQTDRGFD